MLIQKIAIRAAALLLCSTCLVAADVSDLIIAYYGVYNVKGTTTAEQVKDMEEVTGTIKDLIHSQKTQNNDNRSMNQIFRKDPIPNQVKTLCMVIAGPVIPLPKMIGEYDLNGFWTFISDERAKNTK
jgi:hypothetical protein